MIRGNISIVLQVREKCTFLHKEADSLPTRRAEKGSGKGFCRPNEERETLGFRHDLKGTKFMGSIQCAVHDKRATLQKKSGPKDPSLGLIQRINSHERNPYLPKFDDQSQEESSRQERYTRGKAQVQRDTPSNILLAFGCLVSSGRHPQNHRKENLLATLERHCIRKKWMPLEDAESLHRSWQPLGSASEGSNSLRQ